MLLLLLGLLDLWTAVILIPLAFGWIPVEIGFIHSFLLALKGVIFWGTLYSIVDILVGMYILLLCIGISHWVLTVACTIYLLYKAVITLH